MAIADKFRSSQATLTIAALLALPALAACGSSPHSAASSRNATTIHRTPPTPTSPAAMSKFVGQAGLAFGTFHRYVYGPFQAGELKSQSQGKLALAKAGAAAAVAAQEVAVAKQDAGGSTALRKLFAPLAALQPTLGGLATSLDSGHLDPAQLKAANGAVENIEQTGTATGVKISERAPASNP